jgi:protein subunit release factor A
MAERDINGEIAALDATLKSIEAVLDLGKLRKEQVELETQAGVPDLWSDPEAAQKVTSALSRVNSTINKVSSLRSRVTDLPIMLELANSESSDGAELEILKELDSLTSAISDLEIQTLLSGEYDHRDALITIRSEAGGVDASDWAEMVSRMFFRYCERHNYGVSVLETSYGEEAGGQGVNTTDSAVRITHNPTGIVVSCQNERSQIQNKATAMAVLQSKLLERRNAQERAKIDALRGDTSGSWGNQIRSYVLHPYQMVKDHRTDFETGNTQAVLDGDLDGFISSGIRWRRERK